MLVFYIISGLFCFTIACLSLKSAKSYFMHIEPEEFLCRRHTDTIKGIAAAGIVISHIAALIKYGETGMTRNQIVLFATLGGIGVNFFLFLSGYGNYYSSRKTADVILFTIALALPIKWLSDQIISRINETSFFKS